MIIKTLWLACALGCLGLFAPGLMSAQAAPTPPLIKVSQEHKTAPSSKPNVVPGKVPPTPQTKAPVPPASEIMTLADAIQKHYNSTRSATFAFEQSYKHPFLPMKESSKGNVAFKAKKMLWRYLEPSDRQKEFYIDGKKFTYHMISDQLAYTHDCFDQDTLSASITFLWGKGKLKESFIIKPYTGTKTNSALSWLTLTPKEKGAPVKSISLGADKKTGIVKESVVVDQSDGVNHFVFSNLVMNKPIPDKTFTFVAQPQVRVQPMPNVQCPMAKAPASPPAPAPASPPAKALPPAKKKPGASN